MTHECPNTTKTQYLTHYVKSLKKVSKADFISIEEKIRITAEIKDVEKLLKDHPEKGDALSNKINQTLYEKQILPKGSLLGKYSDDQESHSPLEEKIRQRAIEIRNGIDNENKQEQVKTTK